MRKNKIQKNIIDICFLNIEFIKNYNVPKILFLTWIMVSKGR